MRKIFSAIFFLLIFTQLFGNTSIFENTSENEKTSNRTEMEFTLNHPLNFNFSISHFLNFYNENSFEKYTKLEFKSILKPANILESFNLKLAYLPFINFFTEISLGTGWAYPALNFYGLAENKNVNKLEFIQPLYFSKLFLSTSGGIEFYFDLSTKIKTDWTKLIFRIGQLINYRAVFPAKNTDFWFFDGDLGENRNGASYKAYYSIEYYMPLYLCAIKFDFLTHKNLYKPIPKTINKAENLWGFELKNALFFKPAEKIRIKLEAIWKTAPIYHNFNDKSHFTEKLVNSKKVIDLFFESVSASLIFKL